MQNKSLVIIPTFNEAGNIQKMIHAIIGLKEKVDILVIDDASPDGTAQIVRDQKVMYPGRVHLLVREGKQGLGTAYIAGFKFALSQRYEYVIEMDADFSHDPNDVPRLIHEVRTGAADLVIGSRYCEGISIINWPLSRLILSYCANIYARTITRMPIFDTTAGFKCIHRSVIENISLYRVKSNGYAFQIELHFRAWKAGFKLKEISIIFRERSEGVSKMSKKIMREAIWRVWALKVRSIFRAL
jgi:dolichol-phosphate mannosyltransferase